MSLNNEAKKSRDELIKAVRESSPHVVYKLYDLYMKLTLLTNYEMSSLYEESEEDVKNILDGTKNLYFIIFMLSIEYNRHNLSEFLMDKLNHKDKFLTNSTNIIELYLYQDKFKNRYFRWMINFLFRFNIGLYQHYCINKPEMLDEIKLDYVYIDKHSLIYSKYNPIVYNHYVSKTQRDKRFLIARYLFSSIEDMNHLRRLIEDGFFLKAEYKVNELMYKGIEEDCLDKINMAIELGYTLRSDDKFPFNKIKREHIKLLSSLKYSDDFFKKYENRFETTKESVAAY